MQNKYLLFDVDGTLVNTGGAGLRAMKKTFEELLGDGDLVANYSFAGKTDSQIIHDMIRKSGCEKSTVDELAEQIAQTYVKKLEQTLQEAHNFKTYPHVKEFLEAYSNKRTCELALLTGNLEKGAELKLQHAGLWHYFAWGVFGNVSEDRIHLAEKAFEIIKQKTVEINPRNIFIIGDTANDVRCGKAIGATTIAFAAGFESEENLREQQPDFLIYDFKELFGLLR